MENIASFLEKSLREHDVRASVTVEDDTSMGPSVIEIYVRKDVGQNPIVYSYSVTDTHREDLDKRLASMAGTIANKFKEHLVNRYEWNDRSIYISPYSGGSVKCNICNTECNIMEIMDDRSFVGAPGEMSSPTPMPYNIDEQIDRLSEQRRLCLELYCIGELREECNPDCPNSKYSKTDVHPKYDLVVTGAD